MFYVRWSGYGIFAPLIIAAGGFGAMAAARALYGPMFPTGHPWVLWSGIGLGGFVCWRIGSSQRAHTLYGIPMHACGLVAMLAGLFFAVMVAADPAAFDKLRSRPNRVAINLTPGATAVSPQGFAQAVAASEQTAVRLYPALGVAGSDFNTRFLALHKRYSAEQPAYFNDPNWPVTLAREVAAGAR